MRDMDSMTTSTPAASLRRRAAGFTLTEVIVSATIASFLMVAVLSALLFMNRTGLRASAYSELENDLRRGLETFGQEARLAENIRWNSAQSITLTLPADSPETQVTYAYDDTPGSATFGTFYRAAGDAALAANRRVLVRSVDPAFAFQRFKHEPANGSSAPATNDLETKQIQVTLRASRTNTATAGATQDAVSARYLLRNKRDN